jgi:hypothetical protein
MATQFARRDRAEGVIGRVFTDVGLASWAGLRRRRARSERGLHSRVGETVAHTNVAGGQVAAPDSWFAVQVYSGRVVLRASGYLVRDDDTVRRNSLDDEMQRLAENLRADVGR